LPLKASQTKADVMSYADVNGLALYYEEHGDGDVPLILVLSEAAIATRASTARPGRSATWPSSPVPRTTT
jgi:hypothetical protein